MLISISNRLLHFQLKVLKPMSAALQLPMWCPWWHLLFCSAIFLVPGLGATSGMWSRTLRRPWSWPPTRSWPLPSSRTGGRSRTPRWLWSAPWPASSHQQFPFIMAKEVNQCYNKSSFFPRLCKKLPTRLSELHEAIRKKIFFCQQLVCSFTGILSQHRKPLAADYLFFYRVSDALIFILLAASLLAIF